MSASAVEDSSSMKEVEQHDPHPVDKPSSPHKKWKKAALSFIDDQWFLISMGLVIAIASQVQVPSSQQEVKSTTVSYLCVSLIFLATGCTLDTKVLLRNASRWKAHLWVQGNCFLTCSALMFGLVSATATSKHFMDPGLLIGLVFLSCVPTTIASNVVMTGQARGNTELTVVQTSIGNFIGVFLSPALVVMYTTVDTWYNSVLPPSSTDQFPQIYRRVLMQLGLSIYVPLLVGQVIRYFFENACSTVFRKWKFNKIGSLCMLVIIWSTYDQAFHSNAFANVKSSNLVFVVFVLLGMWMLYFSIAFFISNLWFPRRDVISITYCVAAKGPAFGVPLSNAIFAGIDLELESKIQVPIVIYAALQMAFGSILVVIFRKWMQSVERGRTQRMLELQQAEQRE
ncbi:related to sodium bile acid symporter family protein [Ramularia collo-cygni]|uniref:Related to sodium bile acid symporter family protein n=1 Tax=Ramularia collo-cygni TaxID=112498 RepID=A0A2D3VFK5_9PEZI|nr:related to sodium bile acid symporter family protein [Ramularia collo-cygni]CZT23942.1 related to sodium bile acid symporter family protein [Ramularia collo-cygni]